MGERALLGRDRELVEIDEALARVCGGARALVMLTGEPGIGKTRMLDAIASRAAKAGIGVAWGRTWEVGLTPAFFPWIQLLSALERDDDRAPPLGGLEERAKSESRLALFADVAKFVARRAPVALLFDDVHAADPSSLQLLEYVVLALVGAPVLVTMAARDGDATPPVAAAIGRIQRGARRLSLSRLGPEDVAALVGDRADVSRVYALTEGNPLFVEELVASGDLRLPQVSTVRTVIQERVSRLQRATAEALVAAAVVGRDFRGLVAAEVASVTEGEMADLLAPAMRLGMVIMTGPDRYRFSHALIAEVMAEELDPSERARLHLRAAQAVEKHEGKSDGASAIAHHLLAAGHLAAGAAVDAAERAAASAMSQLAFEDAAALLGRAVQALVLAAPDDGARRARLLCAESEALQHASQHARAAELCTQAAAIARTLGDGELLARVALARGLEMRFGLTDPILVEALREALALVPEERVALRARLLARLAAAEQPAIDARGPMARALEAVELSRGLSDRERLDVAYTATAALVDYASPDVLEPIHREVLELARRSGDRVVAVHTLLRLCFSAMVRMDRSALDEALATLRAHASALGLPRWTRHVHMMEAMIALFEGRFADDEREANRVEEISHAIGDSHHAFSVAVHRALARWTRTAPRDPAHEPILTQYVPGRGFIQAWLATQDGDVEAVRRALAQVTDTPQDPDMLAMMASAVAFAGDSSLVEAAYEALLPRRGRIVSTSMVGFAVMDLCDRLLLLLASASERWDAIDAHAESALTVAARIASPVWAARTRVDWAEALERRNRGDDARRARELRAAAMIDAERLDLPGLLARCRRDARSAPPPAAKPSHRDRVELSRSGALWLVRGFGEEVHIKDSRGVQMLARLVSEPGRELHALDLASAGEVDGGDAGELLDRRARAEYRRRREELVAEREEADARGDRGRAERAAEELEALSAELERAVGLGGRDRRAGAATERARSNVQRRVAHAIQQIRSVSRRLGEHLAASIRTGTYCVYEP